MTRPGAGTRPPGNPAPASPRPSQPQRPAPPPRPTGPGRPGRLVHHLATVAVLAGALVAMVGAVTVLLYGVGAYLVLSSDEVVAALLTVALAAWLITSILTLPPRRPRRQISQARAPRLERRVATGRPAVRGVARPSTGLGAAPGTAGPRPVGYRPGLQPPAGRPSRA